MAASRKPSHRTSYRVHCARASTRTPLASSHSEVLSCAQQPAKRRACITRLYTQVVQSVCSNTRHPLSLSTRHSPCMFARHNLRIEQIMKKVLVPNRHHFAMRDFRLRGCVKSFGGGPHDASCTHTQKIALHIIQHTMRYDTIAFCRSARAYAYAMWDGGNVDGNVWGSRRFAAGQCVCVCVVMVWRAASWNTIACHSTADADVEKTGCIMGKCFFGKRTATTTTSSC